MCAVPTTIDTPSTRRVIRLRAGAILLHRGRHGCEFIQPFDRERGARRQSDQRRLVTR
jgi:hypothetical protein